MSIRIGFNGRQMLKRLDAAEERTRRATLMAINDTAETLRARMLREIGGAARFQRHLLRERIILARARTWHDSAHIWAKRKGLPLSKFPHKALYRQQKKGKRRQKGVQVNVAGRAAVMPGAILLGSMIAIRNKQSGRLKALYGPSPSQIFNSNLLDYRAQGERILRDNIMRQLQRAKM